MELTVTEIVDGINRPSTFTDGCLAASRSTVATARLDKA